MCLCCIFPQYVGYPLLCQSVVLAVGKERVGLLLWDIQTVFHKISDKEAGGILHQWDTARLVPFSCQHKNRIGTGDEVPDAYIDQFLYPCAAVIECAQHDQITASLRATAIWLFQQETDALRGQVLYGLLLPFFDRYGDHLLEMEQGFWCLRLCIPEKGMDRR